MVESRHRWGHRAVAWVAPRLLWRGLGEGQVRGVQRMVNEDAYCIDVLTQINAIKAAIDQVGLLLLEDHIKGCVTSAVRQGDQTKVDELVKAVERFAKA